MKTSVEEISPVKKKVIIEVEADEVTRQIDSAYRDLGKRAKIPGFRPGKVPRKILEGQFGKQVLDDVTRTLVNDSLPRALQEVAFFPLAMPSIENGLPKRGEDFIYSAVMEVRPEFEVKDYMGLSVQKEKCAITDEDVEKQLEEVRKTHGRLNPVEEDRPAQEKDYVVVDYEAFENGAPVENIKNNNFLVQIGSGQFYADVEKALVGMKKEESKEIRVAFEKEDARAGALAGKEVDFKVSLLDIKELDLPELDDAFATGLGADFKDLNDLKDKIRKGLEDRENKRIDSDLKGRIMKEISDTVEFELPESLVDSELRAALESVKQNFAQSGMDIEKAGLSEEKIKEDLRPAAENRVKSMLILGEIAKEKEISVDDKDLDQAFVEMGEKMNQSPEVLRKYYEGNNLLDSFRDKLLEEKTLNYLVEGANVEEVEPDQLKDKNDTDPDNK
jgi:trigger factor